MGWTPLEVSSPFIIMEKVMLRKAILGKWMLLAMILAGSILILPAEAQSPALGSYRPNRLPRRAQMFYEGVWGVDSLSVRLVESGEVVRFSYRVVDPERAKALNDGRSEPSLIDPRAGVSLVVPTMEKIGKLRQTGAPEAGKAYWMAFSNKGRPVKKGDRVDVVIGQFRAPGLVVD